MTKPGTLQVSQIFAQRDKTEVRAASPTPARESPASPLTGELVSALWSALFTLEDSASSARWRLTQPCPQPYLGALIAKAEEESLLIREFLAENDPRQLGR
jgi:hypothetical protein